MTKKFDPTRPDVHAEDPKETIKADKKMHERVEKGLPDARSLDVARQLHQVSIAYFRTQAKIISTVLFFKTLVAHC